MAQLFNLLGGVDRSHSVAPRAFAPRPDAQHRAELPASDLDLARNARTNLLIVGNDDVVKEVVTSLWPSLATPIVVRHRGEGLRLPAMSAPVATIVVHDVDTLTPHEQRALYRWIAGNGRTQIVSTASRSPVPLLRAGMFDEALYYRLNVMMLDPASLPARC